MKRFKCKNIKDVNIKLRCMIFTIHSCSFWTWRFISEWRRCEVTRDSIYERLEESRDAAIYFGWPKYIVYTLTRVDLIHEIYKEVNNNA